MESHEDRTNLHQNRQGGSLANLDLLMERARGYGVRGLRQLARDIGVDWEGGPLGPEPYDEARLDTSGEAIEIVTVHSSKGLEWPVIIPINTGSELKRRDPFIHRRHDDTLHWVLGDVVPPAIAGSRARGIILHKLMEELLTGEVSTDALALESRAALLLDQLGPLGDPGRPDAVETAATALRTLALPDVAEWRGKLLPEMSVYAARDHGDTLIAGRADAIAYADGRPVVVFDWKSDVAPTAADRQTYGGQLLEYLEALGAPRGAVVYMTLGQVQWTKSH